MEILLLLFVVTIPVLFCVAYYFFEKRQNMQNNKKTQRDIQNTDNCDVGNHDNPKNIVKMLLSWERDYYDTRKTYIKLMGAKIYDYSPEAWFSDVSTQSFTINDSLMTWDTRRGAYVNLDITRSKKITIEIVRDDSIPLKYIIDNVKDIEKIYLSKNDLEVLYKSAKYSDDIVEIKPKIYPVLDIEQGLFCSKSKIMVNIDGAKLVYPKKIDGIKKLSSTELEIDFSKHIWLTNGIYLDIVNTNKVVIDIKNNNGYHAKFITKQLNNVTGLKITLGAEIAEITSYVGTEKRETNNAIFDKKALEEWNVLSTNFGLVWITKMFKIIEEYFDILNTKYKQYVYTNEWGETVGEEKFIDAINHFFKIVDEKYNYQDMNEYKNLQKVMVKTHFVDKDTIYCVAPYDMRIHVFETDNKVDNKLKKEIINKLKKVGIFDYVLNENLIAREMLQLYIEQLVAQHNNNFDTIKKLSPVEYESQIAIQLKTLGFNARATKASGDQGADVLADKDGVKFAIQCKMYSKPVGNKAIQEANTARDYYNCDYAVVVTNSSYTPAARKAANACGVILLHDSKLDKLLEYL